MSEPAHIPDTIDLLLAGDLMLGRGVNEVLHERGLGYPLAPLKSVLAKADLRLANLECAISPRALRFSGPPRVFYFRADPIARETLSDAGVDLVSLANNHALDADYDGLRDTLQLLHQGGIAAVGAGFDHEHAAQPVVLTAGGMRLGVLGYCDHPREYAAGPRRPGVRFVDLTDPEAIEQVTAEVRELARQVDHVIIAFHWQPNWAPQVDQRYRDLARRLVGAGARLVWGHSPHHFQGVEWIGSSAVIYSAGDFLDDYAVEPNYRNDRQLLFKATLGPEGVQQVVALPLELAFARTAPAGLVARQWIHGRFRVTCAEVGSQVEPAGDWLEVRPGVSR